MPDFIYPTTDLDRPSTLLAALGSLWDTTYQGNALVESIIAAAAARIKQTLRDQDELLDAVSRFKIQVLHTEDWTPLSFLLSQENGDGFGLLSFARNNPVDFGDNSPREFGVPVAEPYFAWQLPAGVVDIPAIVNRITDTSLTLVRGVDYWLADGFVIFAANPATNPLVGQQQLFVNNVPTDTQITLWAFKAQSDRDSLYQQFGYALGLRMTSSEGYKRLINSLLDAIAGGTSGTDIRLAWSAVSGAAVVLDATETVDRIIVETDRILVATNSHIYPLSPTAAVTVAPGQVLYKGDSVSDALEFFEFNRGQCPAAADVPALAVGAGLLAAGYFQDLVFENKTVPLRVSSDPEGFTFLSFELGGWPGDAEQFFADTHARGLAAGNTLAQLLDQRPAGSRDTQPTAGALPATINPLQFLCQNVLQNNFFLVKVKPSSAFSPADLNAAKALRKIIPPGTAMLVLIELVAGMDVITMDGSGTPAAAGYQETAKIYLGQRIRETIDPAAAIRETVKLRQMRGYCV